MTAVSTHGMVTLPAQALSVSVVIPSIGRQVLLDQLLETIITGTESPAEIIVSHSGPSIPVVCSLVRVVHSDEPLLASAARNRGAAQATGRYLLFVDDDNEVEPGFVDGLKQCLDRSADIAVLGPSMYYAGARDRICTVLVSCMGTVWVALGSLYRRSAPAAVSYGQTPFPMSS